MDGAECLLALGDAGVGWRWVGGCVRSVIGIEWSGGYSAGSMLGVDVSTCDRKWRGVAGKEGLLQCFMGRGWVRLGSISAAHAWDPHL